MPQKRKRDKDKGPIRVKKVKQVLFDEDARNKRKKAREAAVRNKAIERERQQRLEMRAAVREERRRRAAENVKQAEIMFGGGEEEGDRVEDDEDDTDGDDAQEYETADLVTTVSVEPFSLSRSPSPVNVHEDDDEFFPDDQGSSKPAAKKQQAPTRQHKKRVKNTAQARPKMTRADKKARALGGKGEKNKFAKRMAGTKGKAVKKA